MPTVTLPARLDTVRRARDHLRGTKRVPFVTVDAIMHFHILEVPGLEHLAENFHQRKWRQLASQLMSLATARSENLINRIADDRSTEQEAFRTEACRIHLMRELAQAVKDIGLGAPEMGN